ncbi:MAG: nucleoside recognition domain-containing protein [Myxococcota bacterium]
MLSWIWIALVVVAIAYGGWVGTLDAVNGALIESARGAVAFVIKIVGVMAIFLGAMRAAFDGGLRDLLARAIAPALRRLFPDVPPDHPAMGAIIMNMASNALGLGNAATPFGIKAMKELDRLNPAPGVASDPMVLFLAINTSAVALFPLGAVTMRAVEGSTDPFSIWIPTLVASTCSTVAGIAAYFALGRLPMFAAPRGDATRPPATAADDTAADAPSEAAPPARASRAQAVAAIAAALLLLVVMGRDVATSELAGLALFKQWATDWLMPVFFASLVLFGFGRGASVYDSAVEGAKEGLEVGVRIAPYLVVILVAVGLLRASGALEAMIGLLDPLTSRFGVPAEVLPMALIRPLSGSGATGVMVETIQTYGPDSFVGQLTCVIAGSTETTFYVLAVYYGAVGVRATRHTVLACLTADFAGFVGAVAASHWWFGQASGG